MKKIVLLLLLSVGLVSLVEAKCNRTYVTNLINQGFSVEQVVRICRTSDKYKTHYKKQKKALLIVLNHIMPSIKKEKNIMHTLVGDCSG